MVEQQDYSGRDLEAMALAVNYHRWIHDLFKKYLGSRVVEVGAGTGAFSELLLTQPLQSLTLVEPSHTMHSLLQRKLEQLNPKLAVETYNAPFQRVARQIREKQHPDSIVYVNVLEHILDEEAELRTMRDSLEPGGRIFIFVPAFQWLFGEYDKVLGHQRRYSLHTLVASCSKAGFKTIEAKYMDFLGIAPWWIKYCLFRSKTMEPALVNLYDRFVVPAIRGIESLKEPPAGKNILLIAEKVGTGPN